MIGFIILFICETERKWCAPAHLARHLREPTEEYTKTHQWGCAVSAVLPVKTDILKFLLDQTATQNCGMIESPKIKFDNSKSDEIIYSPRSDRLMPVVAVFLFAPSKA